jgi:hypothetical protein
VVRIAVSCARLLAFRALRIAITSISDIQKIMMNDGTFQFTLKNKYGGIKKIKNNVINRELRLN